jgi:hypothetical protein
MQALSIVCRQLYDDLIDMRTAAEVIKQADASIEDDSYYHVLSATARNAADSLQAAVNAVSASVPGLPTASVHIWPYGLQLTSGQMPSSSPQAGPARFALALLAAAPIPAAKDIDFSYDPASTRFGKIADVLGAIAARLQDAIQAMDGIPSGDLGTAMLGVAVFQANVKAVMLLTEENKKEAAKAEEKLAGNMY